MSDKTNAVSETEEQLISTAQSAVSSCNWVVGECAAKWTQKYARGRTDNDFAIKIGLTPDQVYQRRRVWETFGDVYQQYRLKWSHFYVALNWDNASDCLQWAEENEATVSEMRAWRRSVEGEDLTEDSDERQFSEWGGDPSIVFVPRENTLVRPVDDYPGPSDGSYRPREGATSDDRAPAFARESNPGSDDYAPFSNKARGGPDSEKGGTATAEKTQLTAEQLAKKLIVSLERFDRELSPALARDMRSLDEKLRSRLLKALNEVNSKISKIY